MQKRLILTGLTLVFLLVATAAVVFYARGYRLGFNQNQLTLAGTGLLVATSVPDGASIFLNGRLTSATNTTLNLPPGTFDVKIVKDGYLPWEKRLKIQEEIVTKAESTLWPKAPKLESLTSIGAKNPVLDPTGTRIAFTVTSTTPKKSGAYVLDMAGRPILTLQNAASLVADDQRNNFSQSRLSWSPSAKELIATISSETTSSTYILTPDRFNQEPTLEINLDTLSSAWSKEEEEKAKARLASLKPELAKIVAENFLDIVFSPDETKILYIGSKSTAIPQIITPPLPGTNSQPEERNLTAGRLYIYDIKEDKNFLLSADPRQFSSLSWMPDSQHLVFIEKVADSQRVQIIEYDGTNKTAVYAGPFDPTFLAPWPDGSKLVILTGLGSDSLEANLYTISLR